jgi:membrane-associated phospholipid phosphatase
MTIAFTVLAELVNVVNPVSREKELINIDRTIFLGVNPVEWLSNYQNPLLTEILQFVYATFYFLPLIPALYLYDKKEHEKLEIYIFSIVLGFCLTYLGYMSVPARSPYLIASDGRGLITFPAPLEGIYITDWLRTTIHSLEEIKWDCFPSGHVALSFITLLSAYLYARKTFYFLLPVVSALVFSTVYLRYHYVIDVIAGLALGCFVVYVCQKIQHFYNERKTKYNELHYDSKLRKSRI